MQILHVGHSDLDGGAARAAYRVHRSLRGCGISSHMRVIEKKGQDPTVHGGPPSGMAYRVWRIKALAERLALRGHRTKDPGLLSPAWFSTGLGAELNANKADIINLHWLGKRTISIGEIGRLNKPVVWRLADMWAFCGAEHYCGNQRYVDGYSKGNRPDDEAGIDINRLTWMQKKRFWTRPISIVCPTRWIADCVNNSALMSEWPTQVIPTAIDLERFAPLEQCVARSLLRLPPVVPLILFGAIGGTRDPRKGADLLVDAIARLRNGNEHQGYVTPEVVVFGEDSFTSATDFGCRTHFLGHFNDDVSLRLAYSAADLMVIPSRHDNLPGTGLEAHACGTPVVAFNVGGLPDIVEHRVTGYLARPFDTDDLAFGINWIISNLERRKRLSEAARTRASAQWAPSGVARQYIALYEEILERS